MTKDREPEAITEQSIKAQITLSRSILNKVPRGSAEYNYHKALVMTLTDTLTKKDASNRKSA